MKNIIKRAVALITTFAMITALCPQYIRAEETQWKYFSKTVTQKGVDADISKPITVYFYNTDKTYGLTETLSINGEEKTRHIQNIYVDEWNFRRVPDFKVNATGVFMESLGNSTSVVLRFDKDIDKWSVKKKI